MSRRFFLKILIALGLGAYFPKLAEAARLEELHTPQDGYAPLTSVKFLRQVVTRDSRSSRTIICRLPEKYFSRLGKGLE